MSIAAGDLQGRSLRLGKGTKITIENYMQPSVITAVPPMHVDYVTPSGGSDPTVLNMSLVPDSFWSRYNVETDNSIQTTNTQSVSHSFGFKEQVQAHYTMGDPKDGTGYEVKASVQATQDVTNSQKNVQGNFESVASAFLEQTGLGDSVVYSSSTVNIWSYEIIGRTICPGDKPNCQESEKLPLTIQFSAPSEASDDVGTATNKEWYQPVWEPGNIFSYPANLAQLQQGFEDMLNVLNAIQTFATDTSAATTNTSWKAGLNSKSTIGQTKTFSGSATVSVAGQVGAEGIASIGAGASFTAHGSDALKNLSQTTGEFNQSTGITFNKPSTFLDPGQYAYAFTPYIFGTQQSAGFVDNVDLKTDIKMFGALQTAFTVDPTRRGSAGGWWYSGYPKPDIALNHPLRWSFNPVQLPTSSAISPECLPVGDGKSMNCATLTYSDSSNPWSDEFHYMRGLFITEAASPGKGPQLQLTTESTRLTLQSRVYNYSLAPLPDNTEVHVRFYGIPWRVAADGSNPANTPAGDAFQIGQDVVLSPIPAFDSSNNAVNWSIASVDWDTSNLGGKYFTFAVVAWAQNKSDGSLVLRCRLTD